MAFIDVADTRPGKRRNAASNFLGSLDNDFIGFPDLFSDFSVGGGNNIAAAPTSTDTGAGDQSSGGDDGSTDAGSGGGGSTGGGTSAPAGFNDIPVFADVGPSAGVGGEDPGVDGPTGDIGDIGDFGDISFDTTAAGVGALGGFASGGLPGAAVGGLLGGFGVTGAIADFADNAIDAVFGSDPTPDFSGANDPGPGVNADVAANATGIDFSDVDQSVADLGLGALGQGSFGDPGGGEGGDSGTVICTELLRQGMFDPDLYDEECRALFKVRDMAIRGYHVWAVPYVRLMRRSKTATIIARPFAVRWAEHITGRRKTVTGWLMRNIGEGICALVGLCMTPRDYRSLYGEDHA